MTETAAQQTRTSTTDDPEDARSARAQDSPFSRLPLPHEHELPAALRQQLDGLESQLGYLPNWAAATALGGEPAQHLNTLLLSLLGRKGELSYQDRDFLALVSSAANGCSYCRLNHIQSFGRAIGDHALATRIGLDYREVAELDDRRRALADFARKVSLDVHSVSDADYADLRRHGLSSKQIIEALLVVTAFAAGNRLTVALNVLPDDEFFDD
jgi:uncharacterized peroxidase-related enzyme